MNYISWDLNMLNYSSWDLNRLNYSSWAERDSTTLVRVAEAEVQQLHFKRLYYSS